MTGTHAPLAEIVGHAGRYHAEVAPFAGLADHTDPRAWADLLRLVGPGAEIALSGVLDVPRGWEVVREVGGVQLVATGLRAEPDGEALRLGPADVPEMLDLVRRTQPGPFGPRTIELGDYVGIRRNGALVAMAGERLRPPGWTEISAVCTDPAYRGRGLATRLVHAVAAEIRARGETPFLHASAANTTAIRLYESLGFTLRQRTVFRLLRSPH